VEGEAMRMGREYGLEKVKELVSKFDADHTSYSNPNYSEAALRTDFIDKLLQALGWDVGNSSNAKQHLREVVVEYRLDEDDINSSSQRGKPDYALMYNGSRKIFIEAKKPSVKIEASDASAFQVRSYGWTAKMPISILTNFEYFIVYDCKTRPLEGDNARVSRIPSRVYHYTDYVAKFDELYDAFSKEAVYSGGFDSKFPYDKEYHGEDAFDGFFLQQIESWRKRLASELFDKNSSLGQTELNYVVQRLLNRIIFLRICEDREQEKYEALKNITTFDELKALFIESDRKYDSGLFERSYDSRLDNLAFDDDVLIQIFRELYFPKSPYNFSVLDASILGSIYEIYISKFIRPSSNGEVVIEYKPEVVDSKGTVPTPEFVVRSIIEKTLEQKCRGKTPAEICGLSLCDMTCGSGIFLVEAYAYLLNYHLDWYVGNGPESHSDSIYQLPDGSYRLTLYERQKILRNNIYGVDIDAQAVEVTRFSLWLKALEGLNSIDIDDYIRTYKVATLPRLDDNVKQGNSLVDSNYTKFDSSVLTDSGKFNQILPFDWWAAFPTVGKRGGFDVLIGNPPYIRIQNMVRYSPDEVKYYQGGSGYRTSARGNIDKYYLFVERSLLLLRDDGLAGFIIPHKFFKIKAGKLLRGLLSISHCVVDITHFGVNQVFPGRSTYTCILILTKSSSSGFTVRHVNNIIAWQRNGSCEEQSYRADEISEEPWIFTPPALKALFDRIRSENPVNLGDERISDIFVGIQTSADKIYILRPIKESGQLVTFRDSDGNEWEIEKDILRPCIYDVKFEQFDTPQANAYVIFPYAIVGNEATLLTEQQMKDTYPLCWAYLENNYDKLKKRSISGSSGVKWYAYGRSQSLTKFNNKPKLIWPILSVEPRYALDNDNIVFTGGGNGPYYALRPTQTNGMSIQYLQGVLYHPVIEAMVRDGASEFRGEYCSHGKQFVEKLPIKTISFNNLDEKAAHDEIASFVNALTLMTQNVQRSKTPEEKELCKRRFDMIAKLLEEKVTLVYGITEAEVRLAKDYIAAGDEVEE
jgi:type I restriction-modification system DNA methylase subunit